MLANFFQIRQGSLLAFEDSAHASKSSSFQALAAVERIAVFDHANHVAGNRVDERTSCVDLSKSEFVVVAVVECVAEIGVKGVNVIEAGKVGENLAETFRDGLLSELDLPHAVIWSE